MLRAILVLILLVLLAAMGVGGYYVAERFYFAPQRAQKAEAEKPPPAPVEDPSLAVWRALVQNLQPDDPAADLAAIRTFLVEHPQSPVRGEAFDLLSQRGAYWIFSQIAAPWKEPYKVVSGDSMNRISTRQKVAAEWIMVTNNLLDYNMRIGQELLIPKPNLRLVASRAEGRLFVLNGEEILLAYPLTFSRVPDSAVGETKVREKMALQGGNRFAFGTPGFITADKVITLEGSAPGFRVLPQDLAASTSSTLPAGLLLAPADLEELFLITQRGTPVLIE